MRALTLATLAFLLGTAGCKKGDAIVVVTVATVVPIDMIDRFGGVATANGKEGVILLPAGQKGVPVSLHPGDTFTFGIQVPAADLGPFSLKLSAFDSALRPLQLQMASTTTSAAARSDLELTFGAVDTDGGVPDMTCPTTCEAAGVACGHVVTSCGDTITCTKSCTINSISPTVVHAGDTVTLEGRFGVDTMINFPNSGAVAATTLGANRVSATVPVGTTSGQVSVSVPDAASFQSADLKVTTFPLGLGAWQSNYPQSDAARMVPQLTSDRSQHATLVVGHNVLVLGGAPNNGPTTPYDSFELAGINADGTLGQFVEWQTTGPNARKLVQARAGLSAISVGGSVIAIGGWDNGANIYGSVEHADINGDGTGIQTFQTSPTSLVKPRYLATAKIIGDYVYVFGGFTSGSIFDPANLPVATDTIERAPITGQGVGPFELLPDKMTIPRAVPAVEIVGDTVYVMGAFTGTAASKTIEKATINGDGTLSSFVAAGALDDTRAGGASIVLGGRVWITGGIGNTGGSMPDNIATLTSAQIKPDGSLDTFMPSPAKMTRVRAAFGGGVIVGNNYYVVGGGGGSANPHDVEYTSINTSGDLGAFVNKGTTLKQHTGAASIVVGNRMYLFGGAPFNNVIESAQISPDGTLGMFSALTAVLANARNGASLAQLGNKIFVFGGVASHSATETESFTLNNDGTLTASSSGPALTRLRAGMQLVAVPNPTSSGGHLYALGGETASEISTELVPLDGQGNPGAPFVAGTDLSTAHTRCSGASIGPKVFLFGQHDIAAPTTDAAVPDASGLLASWTNAGAGALTHSRWDATMVQVGPRLYILGGNYDSSMPKPDATVEYNAITLDANGAIQLAPAGFQTVSASPLMAARRAPVSTQVGNYLYVMDGYGGTDLNSIEQATLK